MRYEGRVRVRRGRASVEPSPTELQERYNAFGSSLTERRYIEAAGMGGIDLEAFRGYLRALGIETEEGLQPRSEDDLKNRGVLVEAGGELRASLYGVLAFGRDPQSFPQTRSFWIECVAYTGTDRASDVVLTGEAKGRLEEQVERAVGWVRGLGRFERYDGLFRTDVPLVPAAVLREALVNAVAHRDYAITGSKILLEVYADRVEVTSPGSLPNTMTPASVVAGGHPRSRNELLANFLAARRLMEQRGRGWPIMRRRMREFNGTEPALLDYKAGRFVRVTVRIAPMLVYLRLDEAARMLGSPPKAFHSSELRKKAQEVFAGDAAYDQSSLNYHTINIRSRATPTRKFERGPWVEHPIFVKVKPATFRRLSEDERSCFHELWTEKSPLLRKPAYDASQWDELYRKRRGGS